MTQSACGVGLRGLLDRPEEPVEDVVEDVGRAVQQPVQAEHDVQRDDGVGAREAGVEVAVRGQVVDQRDRRPDRDHEREGDEQERRRPCGS